MTIGECIAAVDGLKYNTFTREQKLRWLSSLEARIHTEILMTHLGAPEVPFEPFTPDTPMDTLLTAQPPYDRMYLHQLEAEMDYHSGEIEKYNNSALLRNSAYDAFRRYYNRTHMPVTGAWKFP